MMLLFVPWVTTELGRKPRTLEVPLYAKFSVHNTPFTVEAVAEYHTMWIVESCAEANIDPPINCGLTPETDMKDSTEGL